jgi:hypothetical protein
LLTANGRTPQGVTSAQIQANTWLPPLVSVVVGITAALLAGIGIGALRPFGRHSEYLLLVFGPWLFVGSGVLVLRSFAAAQGSKQLNTFVGLVPSALLIVPALFVFTLLMRGQRERWDAAPSRDGGLFAKTFVLPVLPMVALLAGVTWVVEAQDLLWQATMANTPRYVTGPVAGLLGAQSGFAGDRGGIDQVLPLPLAAVLLVAALALQWLYLDRLALRVGSDVAATSGRAVAVAAPDAAVAAPEAVVAASEAPAGHQAEWPGGEALPS